VDTGVHVLAALAVRGRCGRRRLVYCDERGQFQMDPEAVAALLMSI
jgi:hypothetical protein